MDKKNRWNKHTYRYCKIFKRYQKRIDKCHRKNVLNGVFIPKFNSFILFHQTFRYTSRCWPVTKMVEQTVTEAFKVSNAIDSCPETFKNVTYSC